jgi:hypothetical protein
MHGLKVTVGKEGPISASLCAPSFRSQTTDSQQHSLEPFDVPGGFDDDDIYERHGARLFQELGRRMKRGLIGT